MWPDLPCCVAYLLESLTIEHLKPLVCDRLRNISSALGLRSSTTLRKFSLSLIRGTLKTVEFSSYSLPDSPVELENLVHEGKLADMIISTWNPTDYTECEMPDPIPQPTISKTFLHLKKSKRISTSSMELTAIIIVGPGVSAETNGRARSRVDITSPLILRIKLTWSSNLTVKHGYWKRFLSRKIRSPSE